MKEFDKIVFIVERDSVINCKYSELITGIERLKVNQDLLLASRSKVEISIHGYNHDKRELYEIPEVKRWVNEIFDRVEGLIYFLSTNEHDQFLRVIQFCKVDYFDLGYKFINGVKKKHVDMKPDGYLRFFEEIFADLNAFTEENNLSTEINKEITYKLAEYLTNKKIPDHLKK